MTTECEQPNKRIDDRAYDAAIHPGTKIDIFQLKEVLDCTTIGSRNTLLHLAASVGNLQFVQNLVKINPHLVKTTNAQGNTALHLAAQGGFSKVVEILLRQPENGIEACNKLGETALLKACESGNSATVMQLLIASPSSLNQKTSGERTCLYVAIVKGNSELLTNILMSKDAKELIKVRYKNGDTALHVASEKNYVHIMKQLIEFKVELCCCRNDNEETPLYVAAKLGHLEAVKELMKGKQEAVEIRNKCGMNVLHLAAQVSQVRIVECLNKRVSLLGLVNQGVDNASEEKPLQSAGNTDSSKTEDTCPRISEGDKNQGVDNASEQKPLQSAGNTDSSKTEYQVSRNSEGDKNQGVENASKQKRLQSVGNTDSSKTEYPFSRISEGDTPLHIAVRTKKLAMVDSLLRIPGINKDAVNNEGLTAFDIARENTEYHDDYKIIERLGNFPHKGRPFLYSAPKVSAEKVENTRNMVDKVFEDRQKAELVVAVLLATIAFTAAFSIPGGFKTDVEKGEEHMLGTPLLIRSISFKMFIIFDSMAFFLSLLVVLAWQINTPMATEHKLSFLAITNLMVCFTSAFITYSFMAAVYTMLRQNKLAWLVLGACLIITFCGSLVLLLLMARFSVKIARVKHLCGANPIFSDCLVEYFWIKLEGQGLMELMRRCKTKCFLSLYCHCLRKDGAKPKRGSAEDV